jgi:hypothetical protein
MVSLETCCWPNFTAALSTVRKQHERANDAGHGDCRLSIRENS